MYHDFLFFISVNNLIALSISLIFTLLLSEKKVTTSFIELLKYHVHGIATGKGISVLEKKIKELELRTVTILKDCL